MQKRYHIAVKRNGVHPSKMQQQINELREIFKGLLPESKFVITTDDVTITELPDGECNNSDKLPENPLGWGTFSELNRLFNTASVLAPRGWTDFEYGPFQRRFVDAISSERKVAAIQGHRQIGMSTVLQATMLATAKANPGSRVCCYLQKNSMAENMRASLLRLVGESGIQITAERRGRVYLANGSVIEFKGMSYVSSSFDKCDFVFMDSANFFPESQFSSILRRHSTDNNCKKIIITGTAVGGNLAFHKIIVEGRVHGFQSPRAEVAKLDIEDMDLLGEDVSHLFEHKKILGDKSFAQEYELRRGINK